MLAEGRWPCLGSQVKHSWSGVYHESLTLNHAASQGQQLGMSFQALLLIPGDFSYPSKYHWSIEVLTGEKEMHRFDKSVMTLWIQKLLLYLVLWIPTGQYSPWFGVKIDFHYWWLCVESRIQRSCRKWHFRHLTLKVLGTQWEEAESPQAHFTQMSLRVVHHPVYETLSCELST